MKKNKILFFLNSDFGGNQIGGRAKYIIDKIPKKYDSIIFCRDFDKKLKKDYNLIQVIPKGKLIMQILNGISIYLVKRLNTNRIKNRLFEYFLLQKLKKIDLQKVLIIHSSDFLPNVYKYIKEKNKKIKIIQDIPIAFVSILKKLKNVNNLFDKSDLIVFDYIQNSFKYIDNIIAPSKFVKDSIFSDEIVSQLYHKKKISIIPFGVDLDKYKKKKIYKKKEFNVIFVGNVNNRKGISYLIKSWNELNLKNSKLHLIGRIYPEINYILKNSKKNNIKVYGYKDSKDVFIDKDLFVFPTILEGSAKVVYEAMASGIPIITTYNSGSIIRNNKEGFIIPVQNIEEIKKKILFFYNNRKQIEVFGKKARKLVEKFPWSRYGEEVVKTYNLK